MFSYPRLKFGGKNIIIVTHKLTHLVDWPQLINFFCFQQMNIATLYVNYSLERFFLPTDQKINCQEIIQSILIRQLSYDHLPSPVWPTCTDNRNNSIYFEFTCSNCLGSLWPDYIITHCNFLSIKMYASQVKFDCRLILI